MDFISDKLTSLTAPTISRVNEMSKRRAEKDMERRRKNSAIKGQQNNNNMTTSITSNQQATLSLSKGIPFGGDTTFSYYDRLQPPPIGFKINLTEQQQQQQLERTANRQNENQPQAPERKVGKKGEESEIKSTPSDANLYDGDTWSRVWFQRVMILSLIRLLLFIRKVYEDFHATKTYNNSPGHFGHFIIAGATLFLPTIVFTIYRVSRYLQIILPEKRESSSSSNNNNNNNNSPPYPSSSITSSSKKVSHENANQTQNEDDGLVTARQSPMNNMEDFQDSRSSPAPSTAIAKDLPESNLDAGKEKENEKEKERHLIEEGLRERVEIDKLGHFQDRESVRIIIGASEQLLHGILYIFWQLKRQVDVMGYLVERACLWRKPSESEKEQLGRLRTGSDGLEWFQDFYAAFLAILVQVYTLGQHWTLSDNNKANNKQQTINSLYAASGNPLGNVASYDSPELSVSNAAKLLSDTFRQQQQALLSNSKMLDGKDLLIMSELIVSSAVIVSLLIAVRRKDDGPLTLGLSMLGWGSMFASRIIIIALSFVHIGWQIMLPLCCCHVLGITCWIYRIAIDSHNDKKSEQGDESRWSGAEMEEGNVMEPEQAVELTSTDNKMTNNQQDDNNNAQLTLNTSKWTWMEHFTLITQIFTLFSIPSLFYWPIMFNLKAHYRPFKYLILILIENFLLILPIWLNLPTQQANVQYYLLGAVCSFSIVGFIFISLYIACKPSLTEYFARADELFNEAERSGIYFEFCSRVFKMPDLSKHAFRRLMNQTEKQIEEHESNEEINLDD